MFLLELYLVEYIAVTEKEKFAKNLIHIFIVKINVTE